MYDLTTLLLHAAEKKTSDVHLTVGLPPVLRIDGALRDYGDTPLTDEDLFDAARQLADKGQLEELGATGEVDFAVTFASQIRMRCNIYRQQRHTAMALRLLPMTIPTAEELRLPQILVQQAEKPRGLVIVTGPTGSGKSSTLAALLDHINRTERRHIITLENPIEYVHPRIRSVINQREIGADTANFASGLRAALRQDLETISTAVTAAETGHLVFATLHTKSAAATVDRIVDVFPPAQQEQVRIQLAEVLECVISQTLLPRTAGGRVAAFEILVGNSAVRNLIRQNKSYQLISVMQTGRDQGMLLLDDALAELVRSGEISALDADEQATDPEAFRAALFG